MKKPKGRLQNLITYLCFKATSLSTRKIVKLVYLVDVYHYQMYGKRVTDVPFKHYKYGAWAPEIDQTIEELCESGIIKEESIETKDGNIASVPKPSINRTTVSLPSTAMKVLDMVLKDFGSANPSYVVNYTKTTLPFINTPFNEQIDFSRSDPAVAFAQEENISVSQAATADVVSNKALLTIIQDSDRSLRKDARLLTHEEVFGKS